MPKKSETPTITPPEEKPAPPETTPATADEGTEVRMVKQVVRTGESGAGTPQVPRETAINPGQETGKDADGQPAGENGPRKLSKTDRKRFATQRHIIRKGLDAMSTNSLIVGRALLIVKEDGLWSEQFKSYDHFAKSEYDLAKTRAYELAKAAEVDREFSAMAEKPSLMPVNERQMRPLTGLKEPQQRVEAWRRAIVLAGNKPVTESIVRTAIKQMLGVPNKPAATAETDMSEVATWKAGVMSRLKESGYEPPFQQPFNWKNSEAADLYSPSNNRYVKAIGELSLDAAACAMKLRQKEASSLIVICADANAPDGLLYSVNGDDLEAFPPGFNVMARQLGAVLEDDGVFYQAGELNEASDVIWTPIASEDLGALGLPVETADAAQTPAPDPATAPTENAPVD